MRPGLAKMAIEESGGISRVSLRPLDWPIFTGSGTDGGRKGWEASWGNPEEIQEHGTTQSLQPQLQMFAEARCHVLLPSPSNSHFASRVTTLCWW